MPLSLGLDENFDDYNDVVQNVTLTSKIDNIENVTLTSKTDNIDTINIGNNSTFHYNVDSNVDKSNLTEHNDVSLDLRFVFWSNP
jgi:hypothetical protein